MQNARSDQIKKKKKQINADLLDAAPWWIHRSQRTRPEKTHT